MDEPLPFEIRQTVDFSRWSAGLRDIRAKARIAVCIRRLSLGHYGDVKSLGVVSANCASTMARAIGSTSHAVAQRSSSC